MSSVSENAVPATPRMGLRDQQFRVDQELNQQQKVTASLESQCELKDLQAIYRNDGYDFR